MEEPQRYTIKSWAEEDRPREKLILKGRSSLSNAELLAILIGSGTAKLSALDLAKTILHKCNNNLLDLAKFEIKDLVKINGIGSARAVSILAAMELARRRLSEESPQQNKINSSATAYDYLKRYLLDLNYEQFWILLLNRQHVILRGVQVSSGGVSSVIVDPKMIFKAALDSLASGLILAHNHPSGVLSPSQEDIQITEKIKNGAQLLDLQLLDHIIFTNNGYFSFADEDML